jgi:hypothetical protein
MHILSQVAALAMIGMFHFIEPPPGATFHCERCLYNSVSPSV